MFFEDLAGVMHCKYLKANSKINQHKEDRGGYGQTISKPAQIWTRMKPLNELQKIDIYGDPVHERHVYLLNQKKTADDDEPTSSISDRH